MNPRYPVYIISKGRWESRLTVKALALIGVPYKLVIEPQEYENYAAVVNSSNILTLPFSNLGLGSIPARNWVWEHAIAQGYPSYWILDDNIQSFFRLHQNQKMRMTTGTGFRVIEDFIDRYKNIALAGMQYYMFVPRKEKRAPFILNTRIYSCILVRSNLPYRWRGKYNEDTDLSLRILKDGWCTILFQAFLARKIQTMQMKGGNTEELYQGDGRLRMALSLQEQHPDIVKIGWKWGRWQHVVDYRRFRHNVLIRRREIDFPMGINEYDMILPEECGNARS